VVLRIGLAILIALLLVAAYLYYSDYQQEKKAIEFARYAGAIAETSVAAELFRNKPDSFFIVRDSILSKYSLTTDDLLRYKKKYIGEEYQWAEFWDKVVLISDSLIEYQESLLHISSDTLPDTAD